MGAGPAQPQHDSDAAGQGTGRRRMAAKSPAGPGTRSRQLDGQSPVKVKGRAASFAPIALPKGQPGLAFPANRQPRCKALATNATSDSSAGLIALARVTFRQISLSASIMGEATTFRKNMYLLALRQIASSFKHGN